MTDVIDRLLAESSQRKETVEKFGEGFFAPDKPPAPKPAGTVYGKSNFLRRLARKKRNQGK